LKTKITLIVLLALLLQSFIDPYSKKKITDKEFKYEFYTTLDKINPKNNTTYYWFKGGAIHNASEGIAGELLEGSFLKFYLNNQLAEQGEFSNGRKIGLWKTWYNNGTLCTETHWKSGKLRGKFIAYNEKGEMIEKGSYADNKKQGRWINYKTKDTLKYRNDMVVVKKIKVKKTIDKKEDKTKNTDYKIDAKNRDHKNNLKPNKVKKEGFFKRLFSKKNKAKNAKSQ